MDRLRRTLFGKLTTAARNTSSCVFGNARLAAAVAVLFGLALASGCGGNNSAEAPPSARASDATTLQGVVDATWNAYKAQHRLPSGGMAVYFLTPSGAHFAMSGMPAGNSPDTRFRIASNTKTFTAAAIMLLSQQGRLRIDDTISAPMPGQAEPYLPNTAQYNIPYRNQITIRHLLSHRAGVFDITNETIPSSCAAPYAGRYYPDYAQQGDLNHQFSVDEQAGVISTCQLSYFVPNADFHYTNTGFALLARIVERVSGMPYDQFIAQNLLVPNGLSATTVPMLGSDRGLPSPYVTGYLYDGSRMIDVTADNMSVAIGSGNMISTPADLARWNRRFIRGEAGPDSAALQAMKPPVTQSGDSYGLGIIYSAGKGYGHGGLLPGYFSHMFYDPTADVGAVIYCNVLDNNNRDAQLAAMTEVYRQGRRVLGY